MELHFVLCQRFHGATALALLLNNHSKVSSLGDMLPSSEFDQNCGCGKKVSVCPFWQMIECKFQSFRHRAFRTLYPSSPQLLNQYFANNLAVNMMSLVALYTRPGIWQFSGGRADKFIEFYVKFIDTVNEYNNTNVFVDGQKSLKTVLSIKSILGEKARVNLIHLVRDPRAFYCSENKIGPKIGIEESAKAWISYHRRVTEIVQPLCDARYLSVRYEDLCQQPKLTMEKVFDFVGVEYQHVFFPASANHLVGHASKVQFDGKLRQSLKWRNVLSKREQDRCLALTQPMSGKFGYKAI